MPWAGSSMPCHRVSWRWGLHLTGNAADAEDALQATFLIAIQKSTAFDATKSVTGWLTGILAGEARNVRRRGQRRATEPLSEQLLLGGAQTADVAEQRELVAQLRTHIDALPSEQRQVLLLQLQHGLAPAEIAEVLDVAPGTVRMRIHRGLAALRRLLPAGLAVGVLALVPERGLAAVRERVLEAGAAEVAAAAASTMAVTIGGVAVKKVVLLVAAVAVLSLVWWVTSPPTTDVPVAPGNSGAESASVDGDRAGPDGDAADQDRLAADVERRDPAVADPGSLRVVVRADAMQQVSRFEQEVSSHEGSGVVMAGMLLELWAGRLSSGPIDGKLWSERTDANGRVDFGDLPAGEYRLAAMAGGLRLGGPRTVVIHPGEPREFELHITLGGTARGRVVDARGMGVAGARVWVGNRLSFQGSAEHSLRVGAVSDADGYFSVHHVREEEYVAARKQGYGASRSHPLQQLGDGDIELMLGNEAGIIRGEVVDQNGKPLAGVPVAVEPMNEQLRRAFDGTLLGPRIGAVVRTDAAGSFVASGLAPGDYAIQAWKMPYGTGDGREASGGRFATARAARHAPPCRGLRLPVRPARQGDCRCLRDARRAGNGFTDRRQQSRRFVSLRRCRVRAVHAECDAHVDGATRREAVSGTDRDGDPRGPRHDRGSRDGRARAHRVRPRGRGLACDRVSRRRCPEGEDHDDAGRWFVRVVGRSRRRAPTASASPVGRRRSAGEGRRRPAWPADRGRSGGCAVSTREPGRSHRRCRRQADRVGVGATARRTGARRTGGRWRRALREARPRAGCHMVMAGADGYVDWRKRIKLADDEERDLGDIVLQRGATLRVRYQRPDGRPWTARPPMPWLQVGNGSVLTSGIAYAIEGDEVVVTRIPPGTYEVNGPFGDELVIPKTTVELAAGSVRHLDLAVQVGRRRTLTFPVEREQALQVTVRRGDGLVVLDRKVARNGERLALTAVLPIGVFDVEAKADSGARFAGSLRVGKGLQAVEPIVIPRTK